MEFQVAFGLFSLLGDLLGWRCHRGGLWWSVRFSWGRQDWNFVGSLLGQRWRDWDGDWTHARHELDVVLVRQGRDWGRNELIGERVGVELLVLRLSSKESAGELICVDLVAVLVRIELLRVLRWLIVELREAAEVSALLVRLGELHLTLIAAIHESRSRDDWRDRLRACEDLLRHWRGLSCWRHWRCGCRRRGCCGWRRSKLDLLVLWQLLLRGRRLHTRTHRAEAILWCFLALDKFLLNRLRQRVDRAACIESISAIDSASLVAPIWIVSLRISRHLISRDRRQRLRERHRMISERSDVWDRKLPDRRRNCGWLRLTWAVDDSRRKKTFSLTFDFTAFVCSNKPFTTPPEGVTWGEQWAN